MRDLPIGEFEELRRAFKNVAQTQAELSYKISVTWHNAGRTDHQTYTWYEGGHNGIIAATAQQAVEDIGGIFIPSTTTIFDTRLVIPAEYFVEGLPLRNTASVPSIFSGARAVFHELGSVTKVVGTPFVEKVVIHTMYGFKLRNPVEYDLHTANYIIGPDGVSLTATAFAYSDYFSGYLG